MSTAEQAVIGYETVVAGGAQFVPYGSVVAVTFGGSIVLPGTLDTNIIQVGSAAVSLGATTASKSFPVAIATDQTIAVTGSFAAVALQNVNITQVGSAAIALGQTTMAASWPVTMASNQGAIPVSGTVSVDITAADTVTAILAAGGTVAATQSGTWTVQPGNTPNTTAWNVNQIDLLNNGYILGTSTILRPAAVAINGTTAVTLMAATASLSNYITDLVAFRTDTGTTIAYVTLSDLGATVVPMPPASGAGTPIRVPIKSNGTNTAITFTSQAGITGFLNVRGYTGT